MMAKKPSKSDVAAAKKVLKQAGLTGESRKGKAAKLVKAADTSRGESRRGAAGASRAGRGTIERLSESGKTSSQTVNEARRKDAETAREMIKAGQDTLRRVKKAKKSDPTGSIKSRGPTSRSRPHTSDYRITSKTGRTPVEIPESKGVTYGVAASSKKKAKKKRKK
jgi:hypothetical protein